MKNYKGSDLSPEFKGIYRKEMRQIKKILTEMGCTNIESSMQFYYYYGFFTAPSGQEFYFNCSDVRFFPNNPLLYRKVKDRNDFTGQENRYVQLSKLNDINLK
jgi:hypothetical protein